MFSIPKKRNASKNPNILEVESNDDLLTVILVRLPAKSIFRFQCVSKRWNNVISLPFFLQTFYRLRKESALAYKMVACVQQIYRETDSDNSLWRITESIKVVPVSYEGQKLIDKEIHKLSYYFVNISNGLILFRTGPRTILIVNPISRWGIEFPEIPEFADSPAMALVCEENVHDLVLNFRVVLATRLEIEHSYLTINTYCSKIGKWVKSIPTATGSLNDILHKLSTPLVVDDIIYWFTHTRLYLVIYYLETNMIQLAELPSECGRNYSSRVTRSSRHDDLWLCVHMAKSCCMRFWMVSGTQYESYRSRSSSIPSDAWILMHEVNYSAPGATLAISAPTTDLSITTPTPKDYMLLRKCACRSWWRGGVQRKVPYVDFYITKHCDPDIYKRYEFSPYMESLSLSSYNI